uniref:Uncharacterized protein n=1 Tax=Mesocestoides corti TaxID=53468 RepID=A0A5K3FX59_MESCO
MEESRSTTPQTEESDSGVDDLHLTDIVSATSQQLQIPQPQWHIQICQMLAKLQGIVNLLMARLEATSDGEEVDAICIAMQASTDAYNALRSAAWELAMADQTS